MKSEFYIVIDIETAGPNPGKYDLLSFGACTLGEQQETFYAELKPLRDNFDPSAMEIHGLDINKLRNEGLDPSIALQDFADWIDKVTPEGYTPVFVAFNAPFDWMFITEYFYRYIGRNPFGHKALDMKALFMGLHNVNWLGTSHKFISEYYQMKDSLSHHALEDAVQEAKLLAEMLKDLEKRRSRS